MSDEIFVGNVPSASEHDYDVCSHGMERTGDCYRCELDSRKYVKSLESALVEKTTQCERLRQHHDILGEECAIRLDDCFRLKNRIEDLEAQLAEKAHEIEDLNRHVTYLANRLQGDGVQ